MPKCVFENVEQIFERKLAFWTSRLGIYLAKRVQIQRCLEFESEKIFTFCSGVPFFAIFFCLQSPLSQMTCGDPFWVPFPPKNAIVMDQKKDENKTEKNLSPNYENDSITWFRSHDHFQYFCDLLSCVNLSAEGDRFVASGESTRIDRQKDGTVPRADKFT